MVQIIKENRKPTTADKFGQAFSNVGQGVAQGVSQYLKGSAEDAKLEKLGFDVRGISDPQTKAMLLQDQMTQGRAIKKAQHLAGLNKKESMANEPQEMIEEEGEIEVPVRSNRNKSNFPAESTLGTIQPLRTPQESQQRVRDIIMDAHENGIPMTIDEARAQEEYESSQIRQNNNDVTTEQNNRRAAQEKYGAKGAETLLKHVPDANSDQIADFQKIGEEAAKNHTSESDINKEISDRVIAYKNQISGIERDLPEPRIISRLSGSILDTNRDFDKMKMNTRNLLKPLLNEGKYDTARWLLTKKGYGPEETESILSDLGEGPRTLLAQMPNRKNESEKVQFRRKSGKSRNELKNPKAYFDEEKFKSNIRDVFEADPAVNLVLLRKAYDEKDVDWRSYIDELDDMIYNGEIKFNDEQFRQYSKMNEPPLNALDKVLEKLNLVGK